MDIIKYVDILEFIDIVLTINPLNPKDIEVNLEAVEKGKHVVVDADALKTLNGLLTNKCKEFEARDPKTKTYIKEFVAKMCSEWHRHGLLVIENIPDAEEDPYAAVRKQYEYLNNI
jgi:hypothetical protein